MPTGKSDLTNGMPVSQSGFTYLSILIVISIVSVGLTLVSELCVKINERQKIAQLDWIGEQYVLAIESYYNSNTGSVKVYPKDLPSLLHDDRYLGVKRHLRKIYENPITEKFDWNLIPSPDGGISGVQTTAFGRTRNYEFTLLNIQ